MIFRIKLSNIFEEWLGNIQDVKSKARILNRIDRMANGNLGDVKCINKDLFEARIFAGPGYRIYYTIKDGIILLLLIGGDKSTQSRDISKANKILNSMGEEEWKK